MGTAKLSPIAIQIWIFVGPSFVTGRLTAWFVDLSTGVRPSVGKRTNVNSIFNVSQIIAMCFPGKLLEGAKNNLNWEKIIMSSRQQPSDNGVDVTLYSCNMGNATPEDFESWTDYVLNHLPFKVTFPINISIANFRDTAIRDKIVAWSEDQASQVRDLLADLWEEWCSYS